MCSFLWNAAKAAQAAKAGCTKPHLGVDSFAGRRTHTHTHSWHTHTQSLVAAVTVTFAAAAF